MTTELLDKKASQAQTVNVTGWKVLRNTYVCRVALHDDGRGHYSATAVRMPNLVAQGSSAAEALNTVREGYLKAIESQQPALKPFRDISRAILEGMRCPLVTAPSVADIDTTYEEVELTDEQADALLAQRAAGTARATVPLVRFPRP